MLSQLFLELVTVEEGQRIEGRLAVFDRLACLVVDLGESPSQAIGVPEILNVSAIKGDSLVGILPRVLDQRHGVGGHALTLGAAHHRTQHALHFLSMLPLELGHLPSPQIENLPIERFSMALVVLKLRFVASQQKPKHPAKVLIVILPSLEIVIAGEGFEGRCGKQQDASPGFLLEEDASSQSSVILLTLFIDEIAKALELIEDVEIGVDIAQAAIHEALSETAGQVVAPVPKVPPIGFPQLSRPRQGRLVERGRGLPFQMPIDGADLTRHRSLP